jgi:hypothetical protein
MFAETGVKDLMGGIKHLLIKHRAGKPLALRLRGSGSTSIRASGKRSGT